MNAMRTGSSTKAARRAYTLVELVTVMAIMSLLLAVTLPMIAGLNESNNIGQAGQLFADQIALARQTASARNETIEVRCINDTALSPYGFSAIQLWSPATGASVSRVQKLPDGVVISQDRTKVSTLFASYYITNSMPTTVNLGGYGYLSFTVSPSGMVGPLSTAGGSLGGAADAPNMTNLYVGIVPERYATNVTFPTNYMLVQINPITAATITFRP